MPQVFQWLSYLTFQKYGCELLIVTEFEGLDFTCSRFARWRRPPPRARGERSCVCSSCIFKKHADLHLLLRQLLLSAGDSEFKVGLKGVPSCLCSSRRFQQFARGLFHHPRRPDHRRGLSRSAVPIHAGLFAPLLLPACSSGARHDQLQDQRPAGASLTLWDNLGFSSGR